MPGFTLQTAVEIDGTPLDDGLVTSLEEIVFEDYLHQPDMVVVTFRDTPERTILTDAKVMIGSKVKLSASAIGGNATDVLVVAEVTALEGSYATSGSRATIRAYDPSHRLHRGRRTETYAGMKDSDIARKVAQRLGLDKVDVEDSGPVEEHVSQANETDWTFLQRRAGEIGFEVGVDYSGTFFFRKPVKATGAPEGGDYQSEDPLKLVFGQELLEFYPRVSSAEQVKEVVVRGWSPKDKKAVVGTAPAKSSAATLKTDPATLAAIYGNPIFTAVDRPLSTETAVKATAVALSERIGSAFAEAVGVARGNPKLKAGTPINVGVVADDFAGKYVITSSRHTFDKDGYRTKFMVSGRLDRSLLGLANGGNGQSAPTSKFYGVVTALVSQNDDPDKLARVKLKFPWLDDKYESNWARLVSLGAGPNSGAIFIPEVNDEVLVAFEHGDIRMPLVLGSLWNGVDKPRHIDTKGHDGPLFDRGKVKRRGIVSRKGHRAALLDADGESGIDIVTSDDKLRITLDETGTEIRITSEGTVVIESKLDLTIKSGANLNLEATGNVSFKGGGPLKIEGATVDLSGSVIKLN
jgi:phage protein D